MEFKICVSLAHSCWLLPCAHVLHTPSSSAMPSLVCYCDLLLPDVPFLYGRHNHLSGKDPSSSCSLQTFFASAHQSEAARLHAMHLWAFLPFGAPRCPLISCPALASFPTPAKPPGTEFWQHLFI